MAILVLTGCTGGPGGGPSAIAVPSQALLGPLPSDGVNGLRTAADVFYTDVTECGGTPCRVPADVLAPAAGTDHPTIVVLNGGGKLFSERRYQVPLAVELARRGAVVFLAAYRGISTGNYDSDSISDARCAIRYARAHTTDYGGDPDRLLVVGHSQGGGLGLDIAVHPEEEAEACLADGSAIPDGVIALGSPRPSMRDAIDAAPPLWVVSGSEDERADAEADARFLGERGYDVVGRVLPDVTHDGVTDPSAAPEVVDLVFEAIESLGSR